MTGPLPRLLRVKNWDQRFENNRSREMKNTSWVPVPNDLGADSYVELVTHEQGAAHLGVWHALLMVASKAKPRSGLLVKENGRPHTAESLAAVTRLPVPFVYAAVPRLLEIGLLEPVEDGQPEFDNLLPHLTAEISQAPAEKAQQHAATPQEGVVEGKRKEHHHQGGNLKRKELKCGRDELVPKRLSEVAVDSFQRKVDDCERPTEVYASPEDELKVIFLKKAHKHIPIEVLDAIRSDLESARVPMEDFVTEVRRHAGNIWQNPPGFLRSLSKRFRAKTRPADAPLTLAEAERNNYRCPKCFSRTPGEGVILKGDKATPCECASLEYIAALRARGILGEEPAA